MIHPKAVVLLSSKIRSPKVLLSAACLVLGQLAWVAPVAAQQDIIDERQDGFKEMGTAMKTLRDELKRGKPDAAKLSAAAEQLSVLAEKIPAWFPEGSGPAAGLKTDARDYIWENREKFDAISQALIAESKKMSALGSSGDASALQKQLIVIRDNCASCHDSYRVD
ncbi:cytochrome c'' [Cellvibrio japonicus Ueda107]|uniref:Cytochrome c n=1 Tax=Cellvibrio japonicus (strain Ueda107) TaxID=498211 RepID=B3PB85_CELJU|nr:cytochrome c'' [Cellvibrio japonicus Ueda107]QEI11670.1 cytochrome c [Cellvibrio japonicus]QEI15244.1 cytochrome c [Cellvibrio japonicus]QEI18824.1 cytochrome c [Cellvibrio japonicus]